MIENEEAVDGGTHPSTLIPISIALCPTTRCSRRC